MSFIESSYLSGQTFTFRPTVQDLGLFVCLFVCLLLLFARFIFDSESRIKVIVLPQILAPILETSNAYHPFRNFLLKCVFFNTMQIATEQQPILDRQWKFSTPYKPSTFVSYTICACETVSEALH